MRRDRITPMIVASVPARTHLAGNPSDGYGGAVVSATIDQLRATVVVEDDAEFGVVGPQERWTTIRALGEHVARHGHDGGGRLVTAALVTLDRHLPPDITRVPGRFRWSTTIPRSVGLAGSSALVIATMRAALAWWSADDAVGDHDLACLALEAEVTELGIAAGLADRMVQARQGVVLTDCRGTEPSGRPIEVASPLELTLLWNEQAAAPSGDYHRGLERRHHAGDGALAAAMAELAALADEAVRALGRGDADHLAQCLDDSLRLRCRLGPVPAAAMAPVDELRRQGHQVNFTGSGGALVTVGAVDAPAGWTARPVVIG